MEFQTLHNTGGIRMKSMKRNEGETSGNLEMGGVKWYRKKIVEMVDQIESERFLKMIYGYVNSAYREEKSRA